MKKIILSQTVLVIVLLVTSGVLAVATSAFMVQTVAGPQGDVGPKGDTGSMGAQGLKGDTGLTGETGATGPAGAQGATGATGITGAQGPKGDIGATGLAGANGANGATWLSGSGVPASNLGIDGDYYLNTGNNDVYNKASGTWATVTNIKGATGAAGATGARGPMGPAGTGVVIMFNETYAQSSVLLSTDYKTVSNISFTAPSNGTVVLNVNAMAVIDGDSTVEALGLGTTIDAYPTLSHTYAGPANNGGATSYYPITLEAVVPVTENSNYNLCANAWLMTALQPTDLYYVYMTAIFYPA